MTQPATRFVTYLRVSTARQGKSGLGLDAQRTTVEAFAGQHGASSLPSMSRSRAGSGRTGTGTGEGPRGDPRQGGAANRQLNRLARNVAFIANLMDAGVDFVACDQPFASRLTLHILAAVARMRPGAPASGPRRHWQRRRRGG